MRLYIDQTKNFIELYKKIEKLEKELKEQKTLINALINRLNDLDSSRVDFY